jgi:hypothetical protein
MGFGPNFRIFITGAFWITGLIFKDISIYLEVRRCCKDQPLLHKNLTCKNVTFRAKICNSMIIEMCDDIIQISHGFRGFQMIRFISVIQYVSILVISLHYRSIKSDKRSWASSLLNRKPMITNSQFVLLFSARPNHDNTWSCANETKRSRFVL